MTTGLKECALTLDFSTDSLQEIGRIGAVREYLSDLIQVDMGSLDPSNPLHYRARMRIVDGAIWGSSYSSSITPIRTRQLLKDGRDDTSVAAARRLAARAEIAKNLGNTYLGIKGIALQQPVTPRHLQRLFAQEGTSFSDILLRPASPAPASCSRTQPTGIARSCRSRSNVVSPKPLR